MELDDAYALIVHEGTSGEGMVVEVRAGVDPGVQRVIRLRDALAVVADSIGDDPAIDRQLANALFGLSFHMSASLDGWLNCEWLEAYAESLELIEAIFDSSYSRSNLDS